MNYFPSKKKIVIYSKRNKLCPYFNRIFNQQYKIYFTQSEADFINKIQNLVTDLGIICCCYGAEEDINKISQMELLNGNLPVLTCSKVLNPEFVRRATISGVSRFLDCTLDLQNNIETINNAIRDSGIVKYIKTCWPDSYKSSYYIQKFVDEIIYSFPKRLHISEYAERLNIDRAWLNKICKQAFKTSPVVLIRKIWVHQALSMMQHTNLDNMEIAMKLNYSEESSMARDFRKEINCCPKEARKLLVEKNPVEIIN